MLATLPTDQKAEGSRDRGIGDGLPENNRSRLCLLCAEGEAPTVAKPGDGMPAGRDGRGRLRASHLEREHVVEVLTAAFVQGRLSKDEFDARVSQALAARTVAELTALTADLPAGLVQAQQRPTTAPVRARPGVSTVVAASVRVTVAAAALGLLAGIVFTLFSPAVFRSRALVVLPPSAARVTATQVVIADSDPVLTGATRRLGQTLSLPALRGRVQVSSLGTAIISISAQGTTAAQAAETANAVATSYVDYLSSAKNPGLRMQPRVLVRAVNASGSPLRQRLVVDGLLGALYGLLIGAAGALAFIGVWQHGVRAAGASAGQSA
jgi:DUF1707 SHOCT-like domain